MNLLRENRDLLGRLTDVTKRSLGQTLFLFDLCDLDFEKLLLLEEKIKNSLYLSCPGDKEEVEKVLKMEDKTHLLNLNEFKYDDFTGLEDSK